MKRITIILSLIILIVGSVNGHTFERADTYVLQDDYSNNQKIMYIADHAFVQFVVHMYKGGAGGISQIMTTHENPDGSLVSVPMTCDEYKEQHVKRIFVKYTNSSQELVLLKEGRLKSESETVYLDRNKDVEKKYEYWYIVTGEVLSEGGKDGAITIKTNTMQGISEKLSKITRRGYFN